MILLKLVRYKYHQSGQNQSNFSQCVCALLATKFWVLGLKTPYSELHQQTPDGSKPPDRSQECGFLSGFAESLSLKCENAISLAIVVGFGTLFVILILIFIIVKRR